MDFEFALTMAVYHSLIGDDDGARFFADMCIAVAQSNFS